MSSKTTKPGLTAAMSVGAELLAAAWEHDTTTPMAGDGVEQRWLHPSGGEITALTGADGDTTLTMAPLSLEQVAGAIRGAGLTAPITEANCPNGAGCETHPRGHYRKPVDEPATYLVDFATPVMHSQRPGMVAGLCGHAVAPSEWRAGSRVCERCPGVTSALIGLLPQLRPIEITAAGDDGPLDADSIAMQLYSRIETLLDRLAIGEEEFAVTVNYPWNEVTVTDALDDELVLARGVITGPGLAAPTAEAAPAPDPDDYWVRLAAALHRTADQLATLAGSGLTPDHVQVAISGALITSRSAAGIPVVDAVANALGLTATDGRVGGGWERSAATYDGPLRVHTYTSIPAPEQTEVERLRARVAELEAQQAAAGGDA